MTMLQPIRAGDAPDASSRFPGIVIRNHVTSCLRKRFMWLWLPGMAGRGQAECGMV